MYLENHQTELMNAPPVVIFLQNFLLFFDSEILSSDLIIHMMIQYNVHVNFFI